MAKSKFNSKDSRPSLWLFGEQLRIWYPETKKSEYFSSQWKVWALSMWTRPTGGYRNVRFISYI